MFRFNWSDWYHLCAICVQAIVSILFYFLKKYTFYSKLVATHIYRFIVGYMYTSRAFFTANLCLFSKGIFINRDSRKQSKKVFFLLCSHVCSVNTKTRGQLDARDIKAWRVCEQIKKLNILPYWCTLKSYRNPDNRQRI